MSRRRCCCGGCLIFQDYFTPAPLDDLGPRWDVLEGDWHRSNDVVLCPKSEPPCQTVACDHAKATVEGDDCVLFGGTGCNLAMARTPHPERVGSMSVSIRIIEEQPRQYYTVILNAVYDPDTQVLGNHMWATYYTGDPDTNKSQSITLGKYEGGVSTALEKRNVESDDYDPMFDPCNGRRFGATIGSDGFCASVTEQVYAFVWHNTLPMFVEGYYSGMIAGGLEDMGPFRVEHFYFEEHADTDPDCSYCRCRCLEGGNYLPIPNTLTVTIRATGCLETMDGCSFEIEYDERTGDWRYPTNDGLYTDCYCCEWEVSLGCSDGETVENIVDVMVSGGDVGKDCMCSFPYKGPYHPLTPPSTCSPIFWKIVNTNDEPFTIGSTCTDCCPGVPAPEGTFWLEITA